MQESWDWTEGESCVLNTGQSPHGTEWTGEFSVSQDGTCAAGILMTEDGEFGVQTNKVQWKSTYDNLWNLKFTPDNRCVALTSSLGVWTVTVDQESWPEEYEYIWSLMCAGSEHVLGAAIKSDGQYGMARDGMNWPHLFPNATGFTLGPKGAHTACVVQTAPLGEGDIQAFQQGVFTVAKDGVPWEQTFLNVWSPCFDSQGEGLAATVRTGLDAYTIAVDGLAWPETYAMAWEPVFNPVTGAVVAPVQMSGHHWGLAQDNHIIWDPGYEQLWQVQVSPSGSDILAIGAPKYGHFTVIRNNRPWHTVYPVLTDLTLSPEGERAAAVGQCCLGAPDDERGLATQKWQVVVDDEPWSGWYDRVLRPVFSPDGEHVAVRVKHEGKFAYLLDGSVCPRTFDAAWDPVFSPDGQTILLRVRDGNRFLRIVRGLGQFTS